MTTTASMRRPASDLRFDAPLYTVSEAARGLCLAIYSLGFGLLSLIHFGL